jgi:hypothetical protein
LKTQEIISELNKGNQFKNEAAEWFTLCNIKANRMILDIKGEIKIFADINKYAKRIQKLINTGE